MATPFRVPAAWQWRPSPNHSARSTAVSAIVLHADASARVESSLDWCRRAESQVSYHVLIGRNGVVYCLVHPDRKAWHAGASAFAGQDNCNAYSVGVCLSNRNDGVEPYPAAQRGAAADVLALLMLHYGIPAERVTTHAAVATPAGRKSDPKGLAVEELLAQVQHRLPAGRVVP